MKAKTKKTTKKKAPAKKKAPVKSPAKKASVVKKKKAPAKKKKGVVDQTKVTCIGFNKEVVLFQGTTPDDKTIRVLHTVRGWRCNCAEYAANAALTKNENYRCHHIKHVIAKGGTAA